MSTNKCKREGTNKWHNPKECQAKDLIQAVGKPQTPQCDLSPKGEAYLTAIQSWLPTLPLQASIPEDQGCRRHGKRQTSGEHGTYIGNLVQISKTVRAPAGFLIPSTNRPHRSYNYKAASLLDTSRAPCLL